MNSKSSRRRVPERLPACIREHTVFVILLILMIGGEMSVDAAQPESPASPTGSMVEELETQRKAAAENTVLDESIRARIDELYGRAIDRTREAVTSHARTQQLADELSSATETLRREQQRLDRFTPARLPPAAPGDTSDSVTRQLTEARAAVSDKQEQLQATTAETERRSIRRSQLPTLRLETQQKLESVEKELAAEAPENEPAEQTAARRALLQARRYALQAELAQIDQETRTYGSTDRLWSVRRDIAEREVKDAERVATELQERLAEIQQREALAATQAAQQAAANAHPAVREAATRNATLAEDNQKTLAALENTRQQISDAERLTESLVTDFDSLQKRAEAAGFSQAIGVLLRNQQNRLPETAPYIRRAHERHSRIAGINLQLIEWESERNAIIDIEEPVEQVLKTLPNSLGDFERADIGVELRTIFTQQRDLLSDTIENGKQYLDRLVALDSAEQSLIDVTRSQSEYIAQHVLWVRSAEPFGTSTLSGLRAGGAQVFSMSSWGQTFRELSEDLSTRWLTWAVFGLLILWLLATRPRFRQALREDGVIAARTRTTTMRPTIRATANSFVLAAIGPGVMWFVGWRISAISLDGFSRSVGLSLKTTAVLWFGMDLIRQLIRRGGVCDLHFDWPDRSLIAIRRWLGTAVVICTPAIWLLLFCDRQDDNSLQGSVGRVAFVVSVGIVSLGLFQLLRANGVVTRDLQLYGEATLLVRSRPVWATLVVLAPAGLGVASLLGFHYSALQLAERLMVSAGLIAALILVCSLLNRWLLMTYRQLAINRARQKREALLREAKERGDDELPTDIMEAEAIPEVSLADVNEQTNRLIRIGAFLCGTVGLWLIWIDVLPALGILRSVELWKNQIAAVDSISGETAPWITLADLVVAMGVAILTFVAARNVPGLLEIAVLQRLPMDAGARYAASSLTRYLIAVIGVTLGFWMVGIGWSSVQWLIAAMTVGLGFGLQEIFANFVSGLILLFERPVRVGDTVTVNDITGTVSRIRIRATTILDWDNKELIVPNRAFVTDNLINWTLSNPHLRMILRVGVAYGSDTRKTTELLYRVAEENSLVMEDPEPTVVFDSFGDSSLNFELRLFVSGPGNYRRLRHDLNMAIDDEFRKAQIEIAFPQRDLHVRSLPSRIDI